MRGEGEGFDRRLTEYHAAGVTEGIRQAREAVASVRDYIDDPGNWSALDGRRALLLKMLDDALETI